MQQIPHAQIETQQFNSASLVDLLSLLRTNRHVNAWFMSVHASWGTEKLRRKKTKKKP
jgi:hypothetical protein